MRLRVAFDFKPLNGLSGSNSFPVFEVSYADFKAVLAEYAPTADDLAAVASLPSIDPTHGAGVAAASGLAQILGLAPASDDIDDTVTLNSRLPWAYRRGRGGRHRARDDRKADGPHRQVGLDERGKLGPLDLFRYSSPGVRDHSGGADSQLAYFSVDGKALLVKFHNAFSTGRLDGQDFGDWDDTKGDAFGLGGPGSPGQLTAIDLRILDTLGRTPTPGTMPAPSARLADAVVS